MANFLFSLLLILIIILILKKYFPDTWHRIFDLFSKIEDRPVSNFMYQYERKNFLISKAEHEFFDILIEILNNKYYIFTQVHLPTILEHKLKGQNWRGAFSHINQKSVDFVICDKDYLRPLLVIELDDMSHNREDRKERDKDVEEILASANLPLLRIKNSVSFEKEEITHLIHDNLK